MPGGAYITHCHCRGRGGFTLAEALLASVILAIVAASATLPVIAAAQNAQEADKLKYAVEFGEALLDEISARPLKDSRVTDVALGPSATETSRKAFLNVDAFDGYSESDMVLRDYEGKSLAAGSVSGYWRTSSVSYVSFSGQASGDTNAFAVVRVNVYFNSQLITTLSRLVSVDT